MQADMVMMEAAEYTRLCQRFLSPSLHRYSNVLTRICQSLPCKVPDHLAVAQHNLALVHVFHQLLVVGHGQHRGPLPVHLFQQPHDFLRVLLVQVACGLIRQQQYGLVHHCPGKGGPLPLPS